MFFRRRKIDESFGRIHAVLTESTTSPAGLLKDAMSMGIPVVGAKWLIQSIINGKAVGYGNFPAL